jgi:hypothetical protein
MPVVRFSQEDFLRGKVIRPGWYHAVIKAVNTKPAKTDGSTNYIPQMKIVEPGDYFGIPVDDNFSEKALGISAPRFVRACNGGVEPKADENYELANGVGKVVKVQISNSLFNGRVKNDVNDYDCADANFQLQD